MNKNVWGQILIFSMVGMILIFIAIFLWAFNNDYLLYNVNVQAESLQDSGIISQSDLDNIERTGNIHAHMNFRFDDWWFASFLIMFISTILISYYSRELGLFSFLGNLFFGTMFVLFLIGIISQVNEYILQEIFYKLLPSIQGNMPKFEYYMEHVGIISFIHMGICLFANRVYFKVQEFTQKRGSEFLDDEEEIL